MAGGKTDTDSADDGRSVAVEDVSIEIVAILGVTRMPISTLLKMGRGAVVELDSKVGDSIVLTANGQPVARGEVVLVDDKLAVEIGGLLKQSK